MEWSVYWQSDEFGPWHWIGTVTAETPEGAVVFARQRFDVKRGTVQVCR